MSKKFYNGHYKPKNPSKYIGDLNNICYRSSWELGLMSWCDLSSKVIHWSSEETIIPYVSPLDNKWHRYFIDFYIELENKKYYIEVKPLKETKEPKPAKNNKSKKYLTEVTTYIKNISKWEAATKWATSRGATFAVFTEKTLRQLGINI